MSVPSTPPASALRAAFALQHAATQELGEGMRAGTIKLADANPSFAAAIWRHDPEAPSLIDGGPKLEERIVFTIRKTLLGDPTLLFGGDDEASGARIIYVELGRAFVVKSAAQETADHSAWKFEARRAPGSDPA